MESHASASASASASKKKKLSHGRHHHEEDNEEKEMEEFFALVRSIREARDRLKINGCSSGKKQKENCTIVKRKLDEEDKQPVVEAWKPTFQREDFLIEDPPTDQLMIKYVPLVTSLPSSSQNKETTEQKADQDIKDQALDLTLSL